MKNKNKSVMHKVFSFLPILVVMIIVISILLATFFGYEISKSLNEFSENEKEVIEISKTILENNLFSKSGSYSIYMLNNEVIIEEFDVYEHSKGSEMANKIYSEFFKTKWLDKDAKISVDTYYSEENACLYKSVTYKKDFIFGKFTVWVYYGDFIAFPGCPHDGRKYDWGGKTNIKELTNNLYYACEFYP